ncbi:MAG TPA: M20/M25/M40 family metallo-hydrolase [Edaphocola sp.]|nr:M20/M25/M40 family metallo-hydrolase [Edaphocola sp.]
MKKLIKISLVLALNSGIAFAQVDTNILNNIQNEVNQRSQLEQLGQQLMDDIGPRLMGTPEKKSANEWVVNTYKGWGIQAHNEQYGTWKGWQRAESHAMMTFPRFQQLNVKQLAWSPATPKGKFIEAEVIEIPLLNDSISWLNWLPNVKGKIVLVSQPQLSGRPNEDWKEHALEEDYTNYLSLKNKKKQEWNEGLKRMKTNVNLLQKQLEDAGAIALVSCYWSEGWGVNKIFGTKTEKIVHFDMELEDYLMLYRLVKRDLHPKIKLMANSKFLKEMPAENTIAEIKSRVNPDEYVMLSAHLDSWDGATGATDNGTGTILMMEVMRILKKYYPNPKRSIIVGHWGGEEQGLVGSRSFAADHADLMPKISVAFNQDNGTGRINWINGLGFLDAYDYFNRWFAYLPEENRKEIKTDFPGNPGGRGGSDYASFLPYDVPSFFLISSDWNYGKYTWHTNRDTYDKIVWEDMKRNAITIATMVYLACEEPGMFSRRKADLPLDIKSGKRMEWPKVQKVERNSDKYFEVK